MLLGVEKGVFIAECHIIGKILYMSDDLTLYNLLTKYWKWTYLNKNDRLSEYLGLSQHFNRSWD